MIDRSTKNRQEKERKKDRKEERVTSGARRQKGKRVNGRRRVSHLLLGELQQLFLGSLHLSCRPTDGHPVHPRALSGEVNVNASTLLHHGAHQTPLRPDQRVVQLGRDGHLRFLQIGLEDVTRRVSDQALAHVSTHITDYSSKTPFVLFFSFFIAFSLCSFSHQVSLYGEDALPRCLTVTPLPCDHDRLRVAVLRGEVDLRVGLFADLQGIAARFIT